MRFTKLIGVVLSVLSVTVMCLTFDSLSPAFGAEKQDDEPLIFGVFPRRNATATSRIFRPLIAHLSREIGREIRLDIAKDFNTFWEGVVSIRYDIIHSNQYHYVKAHQELNYQVILKNVEFGQASIAGSILVRKNSGINTPSDLKGKKIIFGGGPRAMQSYITAIHLLRTHGLKPGDYQVEFAKNPPNAVMSTYYGQSAAAGSGDKVLNLAIVKKEIDITQLTYLIKGAQLPHLPWAVKGSMPIELQKKIQSTLAKLQQSPEGRLILEKAKLSNLEKATDSEYDEHRRIIYEVLGEQY